MFFLVFILLGLSNVWQGKLNHDFPYAYLASDSFFHQSVAQFMKEEGKIKFTPAYEVGGHDVVFDAHPPILFELSGVFSYVSGLEVYDTIYFIALLSLLMANLVLYLIIKKFNRNVAILSLPITLMVFSKLFSNGLFWGMWHFILGVYFMLAVVWCTANIRLKYVFVLIGIFFAATLLTHPPEAVFVASYLILFLILDYFLNKRFYLKELIFGGILGTLLAIYYVNIFMHTFLLTEGFRGTPAGGYFGFPDIFIIHLGFYLIIFSLGIIFWLLSNKKEVAVWLMSFFFFGVSYLTYIGFGKRAFTHRFFWWTYLAFFFGLAIYFLVKLIYKRWDIRFSAGLAIILLIIFTFSLSAATRVGQGLMDSDTWEALNWVSENLEKEAIVHYFVFPPDGLSQAAALYNSRHLAFKISHRDVTGKIQQGQLGRAYNFGLADSYAAYMCELGAFRYGFYRYELDPGNDACSKGYEKLIIDPPETDICRIKYYYFNKASAQPAFAQFNSVITNTLLQNEWIKPIYENQRVILLKNEKPGEECLNVG